MAWQYSAKEFIKMYRKFMEWEWYTNTNTKALFIHCLLKANWKPGIWRGINYKAGEFITSLPNLSEETGLSIQQVRTALSHLISTGELTSTSTDKLTGEKIPKCRIITVNNWDAYQGDNRKNKSDPTERPTGQQQDANRTVTSDIRSKEDKNIKNKKEVKEKPAALPPSESDKEELVGDDYDDFPSITWDD